MTRDDGRPCDVTQEYRDNWEATFGHKTKRKPSRIAVCHSCRKFTPSAPWSCVALDRNDGVTCSRWRPLPIGIGAEAAASCSLDGDTHCVDEKGRLVP